MNLYLLINKNSDGYDVYDSAVVCAECKEEARLIHPDGPGAFWNLCNWCMPEDVKVELIGEACRDLSKGLVCVSYKGG